MAAASRIPKTRTRFQLAVLLVHDCNEFRVEKLFLKSDAPTHHVDNPFRTEKLTRHDERGAIEKSKSPR